MNDRAHPTPPGTPAGYPPDPAPPGPIPAGELADALEEYLRVATFPVAVRFARPGGPLPPKTRRPWADMGVKITICQGISIARRYGWSVAVGGEDLSCPIAGVAFGFEEPIPFYAEGQLAAGMYVRDGEAGARTEAAVPKLALGEAETVWLAPLRRAAFEPQGVLVYGNSAQVMRLVTAALWRTGGSITSEFSGRADCADLAIAPVKSGRPQVILPCYGDRVFGQTQDDEMAFSFPFAMGGRIAEGLRETHKGGIRYPIPSYLRYTPGFPESYEKLKALWAEAKGGRGEDG